MLIMLSRFCSHSASLAPQFAFLSSFCVIKMGNCVSLQVSCDDQTLNRICSCFFGDGNLIKNLHPNLKALQRALEELKATRTSVLRRIETDEFKGLQRTPQVQVWLSMVDNILPQVSELLDSKDVESQRLCLCGFCSKNFFSSYAYSKKVSVMLKEVQNLISSGSFDVVADRAPPTRVVERDVPFTIGQEETLEETWGSLMRDEVRIVGLHGMGGVGKTTLLTKINNRFLETNGFDIVFWIMVSKDLQIQNIQEAIGKRIGLCDEQWKRKPENEKADDIFQVLKNKIFVLLLDDIWREVTLSEIGVPSPTIENRCKVVLTTRSEEVCRQMEANVEIEVKCLTPEEAWELFQKKVGETTLKSHPDIPVLARKICEKCCNLPLALSVVGKAMACKKTVQEWQYAINVLSLSSHAFPGMDEKILRILKFSYDNLKDEKVKSCFLYCALFPEDCEIDREELIDYWICEGIIDGYEDRDRAVNEGHEILGTLLYAHLLMDDESAEDVKMHDVIREMALWITSQSGEKEGTFFVKTGVGLREVPMIKNWEVVRRMSLMSNKIEHLVGNPRCPELTTLFIQHNYLVNITGEFFQFMQKILVLDLSHNLILTQLPEEISNLVSLQYLNLSWTEIEQLPTGFEELRKLTYLNLEYIFGLGSIRGISSLLNLQVLRFSGSGVPCDLGLVEELQSLKHLTLLTTSTIKDASILERFLGIHRLASITRVLSLKKLSVVRLNPAALGSLRNLGISKSDVSEIKINSEEEEREMSWPLENQISLPTPCFHNLSRVLIAFCKGLRDVTWLLFAPNLTHLEIYESRGIEKIIEREKADVITNGGANLFFFEKLEELYLSRLDELKSIWWSPLPFPSLRKIKVIECPKLKKLPLNSESCKGHNVTIIGENEWEQGIEWEDEATKDRFFPMAHSLF